MYIFRKIELATYGAVVWCCRYVYIWKLPEFQSCPWAQPLPVRQQDRDFYLNNKFNKKLVNLTDCCTLYIVHYTILSHVENKFTHRISLNFLVGLARELEIWSPLMNCVSCLKLAGNWRMKVTFLPTFFTTCTGTANTAFSAFFPIFSNTSSQMSSSALLSSHFVRAHTIPNTINWANSPKSTNISGTIGSHGNKQWSSITSVAVVDLSNINGSPYAILHDFRVKIDLDHNAQNSHQY